MCPRPHRHVWWVSCIKLVIYGRDRETNAFSAAEKTTRPARRPLAIHKASVAVAGTRQFFRNDTAFVTGSLSSLFAAILHRNFALEKLTLNDRPDDRLRLVVKQSGRRPELSDVFNTHLSDNFRLASRVSPRYSNETRRAMEEAPPSLVASLVVQPLTAKIRLYAIRALCTEARNSVVVVSGKSRFRSNDRRRSVFPFERSRRS